MTNVVVMKMFTKKNKNKRKKVKKEIRDANFVRFICSGLGLNLIINKLQIIINVKIADKKENPKIGQ
jgi:hypothetical protein